SVPGGTPSVSASAGGGGSGTSRRCRQPGIARPMIASISVAMIQVERRTLVVDTGSTEQDPAYVRTVNVKTFATTSWAIAPRRPSFPCRNQWHLCPAREGG